MMVDLSASELELLNEYMLLAHNELGSPLLDDADYALQKKLAEATWRARDIEAGKSCGDRAREGTADA